MQPAPRRRPQFTKSPARQPAMPAQKQLAPAQKLPTREPKKLPERSNAKPRPISEQPPPVRQEPMQPKARALIPEVVAVEFDRVDGTGMFDTLQRVRALPAEEASRAIVCRTIAEAYGYATADLFAIAEIGRHYLESGGYRLAALIFEGLEALAPDQQYFSMALGLSKDRMGDKTAAMSCYRRAQKLDPRDPRADLNLAELLIEAGQRREAIALIEKAERKAKAAGEGLLEKKACALLSLLGVRQ